MAGTEVKTGAQGTIGFMHNIDVEKDSVIVFQAARRTQDMSNSYIDSLKETVHRLYPNNLVLIIGCDMNIYELAGPEALTLKLKGLI